VRTAANSSARLTFFEGSTTDVAAETGIRLDALQEVGTEAQVRLLQTAGVTQAQVQQAPDRTTSYQVETAAALVSASTRAPTCPWVRVDAHQTVLVRNYSPVVQPRVAAQSVVERRWVLRLVPGPLGPIVQPWPRLVTVQRELPPSAAPHEQPLVACPFGDVPDAVAVGDSAMGPSDERLTAAEPYRLASAEPARTPWLDRLGVGETGGLLQTQTRPYAVTVQNRSGPTQEVRIPRGEESEIRLGQPPSPPVPIGTFAAQAAARAASAAAQGQAAGEPTAPLPASRR
jgi:hypothetical protein